MTDVTTGTAAKRQEYYAGNNSKIADEVKRVIGIFLPRAFVLGGFDERGNLLTVQHTDYKKQIQSWLPDFFEHSFLTEPLLSDIQKLTTVFIATDKYLLTPGILYNEIAATKWLSTIHFIEATETVINHYDKESDVYYTYTWPSAIKKLLLSYFLKTTVLPLAAYQLNTIDTRGYQLQCCISGEQVIATLNHNGTIQWHQSFNYQTAEDIAYHIKLLCKQYNITDDELQITCTATSNEQSEIISRLGQYFSQLQQPNNDWANTISLFQQLYTCAL